MGFLGYSPQSFFVLEPFECVEILKKAKAKQKFEHELMYIAVRNAIGSCLQKNYKYYEAFENENQKKEVTEEEKQDMIDYLENW